MRGAFVLLTIQLTYQWMGHSMETVKVDSLYQRTYYLWDIDTTVDLTVGDQLPLQHYRQNCWSAPFHYNSHDRWTEMMMRVKVKMTTPSETLDDSLHLQ